MLPAAMTSMRPLASSAICAIFGIPCKAVACPPLTPAAVARLARAEAMRLRPETFDVRAALERVDAMLGAHAG